MLEGVGVGLGVGVLVDVGVSVGVDVSVGVGVDTSAVRLHASEGNTASIMTSTPVSNLEYCI